MARVALLDANVLWPQYLRDVLIRATKYDLYRGAWTVRILDEMRNSVVRRGQVPAEQIDRAVNLMLNTCPHFLVDEYEGLIPVMTNDEKDRHVLAAAVVARADTIVTNNLKDFPLASRKPYGIDLHTPDQFLIELWLTDSHRMSRMLVEMAGGLKKPPLSVHELVQQRLSKQAPRFAEMAIASDELDGAIDAAKRGVPLPQYRLL